MNSNIFSWSWGDFGKGLLIAVLSAVFTYFGTAVTATGFSFATMDWSMVVHVAEAAFMAYMTKNFVSSNQGHVFGIGDRS